MTKRILGVVAIALVIGIAAPTALACWDNSDLFVTKLQKAKLTTEQLKEIFELKKEHKAVVVRAHKEGLGCRYHENHEAVFEKQAVGVLTDEQFKKVVGRKRSKVESLTYENKMLKKKLAAMEKRLAALEKLLKESQAKKKK
ncbi:MAG: hypothetical protein ACYTGZ_15245 [Planctomycetota bacterium]|jgi:hypothetical protein